MQDKLKKRAIGPDLLKIAATIFVIVIHHKYFGKDPVFVKQFNSFFGFLFIISLCLGVFFAVRMRTRGESVSKCLVWFLIPLGCFVALRRVRRFAVPIFMLVTGYLLTSSVSKLDKPIKKWYTKDNLILRIIRFYLPFIPVFIVGLVYKIIVKDYDYTALEVIARFILGGFKPGSYYITVLAEMVLIFPVIYLVVKRFKAIGVGAIVLLNLIYDALCTFLGMNDILYKFLVFRFIAHIALGVYGRLTDFKKDKAFNFIALVIGLGYVVICIYSGLHNPHMFFQWRDAAFPVAIFMYVPVMWFINVTKDMHYTDSKLSKATVTFANATYHIFLIQLLYYTTFGFEFNEWVYNVAITMPLNLIICIPFGIWYYKLVSPIEKTIADKVAVMLKKAK